MSKNVVPGIGERQTHVGIFAQVVVGIAFLVREEPDGIPPASACRASAGRGRYRRRVSPSYRFRWLGHGPRSRGGSVACSLRITAPGRMRRARRRTRPFGWAGQGGEACTARGGTAKWGPPPGGPAMGDDASAPATAEARDDIPRRHYMPPATSRPGGGSRPGPWRAITRPGLYQAAKTLTYRLMTRLAKNATFGRLVNAALEDQVGDQRLVAEVGHPGNSSVQREGRAACTRCARHHCSARRRRVFDDDPAEAAHGSLDRWVCRIRPMTNGTPECCLSPGETSHEDADLALRHHSAPYFAESVASSCIAIPICCAASGRIRNGSPISSIRWSARSM